jgi:adenine specific DNA methylase Mod
MDAIFEARNFRNEISWQRTTAKSDYTQGATHFPRLRDILLFYRKDIREKGTYHQLFLPHPEAYLRGKYHYSDPDGRHYRLGDLTGPGGAAKGNPFYEVMGVSRYWRYSQERMEQLIREGRVVQTRPGAVPQYKRYLDEMPGVPLGDSWDDIRPINAMAHERLGYPTQKPLPLLERIIQASSNEGDVVLDPFCGCGTAIHAAQKLSRYWIGIDITHLAISLIEKRLNDAFPGIHYDVHGTPKDLAGARALADQDKYQFQWWAVSLVNAVPYGGKKKGADSGIDGLIYFKPDGKHTEKAIVSVKGGGSVSVPMIRELAHVVDREQAKVGIFLTLTAPTSPMQVEATKAGFYDTVYHGKVPKIQILTIAELFAGKKPQIPFIDPSTFRRARQEETAQQERLF